MELSDAIKILDIKQSPEFQQRLAESKFGLAYDGETWREMTEDEWLNIKYEETKRKS